MSRVHYPSRQLFMNWRAKLPPSRVSAARHSGLILTVGWIVEVFMNTREPTTDSGQERVLRRRAGRALVWFRTIRERGPIRALPGADPVEHQIGR